MIIQRIKNKINNKGDKVVMIEDNRKKLYNILVLLIVLILAFSGCSKSKDDEKLIIAEQYGLAYAPLQIMKENGYLEALLPDTEIEWVTLSNTSSIRESMLSGHVDMGFVGIPPFIIGLDHGMDWKIMCGLSENPSGLVSNDSAIKTLSDFKEGDKIALPQPGSIQHILLAMACEKQFNDATKLDDLLLSMRHPDAYQSLESKATIKAHFASPPYLFDELKNKDNQLILSGKEAFGGDFTFIVGVCDRDFYKNKEHYEAVKEALTQAMDFMDENKEATIKILSNSYNIEAEILKGYLEEEGMNYTTEVKGADTFVDFMLRNGYIKNDYQVDELIWE